MAALHKMKEKYSVGTVVKVRAAIKGTTDFVPTTTSNNDDTAAEATTGGTLPPRACITDPKLTPKLQLISQQDYASEQDYDEEVRVVQDAHVGSRELACCMSVCRPPCSCRSAPSRVSYVGVLHAL